MKKRNVFLPFLLAAILACSWFDREVNPINEPFTIKSLTVTPIDSIAPAKITLDLVYEVTEVHREIGTTPDTLVCKYFDAENLGNARVYLGQADVSSVGTHTATWSFVVATPRIYTAQCDGTFGQNGGAEAGQPIDSRDATFLVLDAKALVLTPGNHPFALSQTPKRPTPIATPTKMATPTHEPITGTFSGHVTGSACTPPFNVNLKIDSDGSASIIVPVSGVPQTLCVGGAKIAGWEDDIKLTGKYNFDNDTLLITNCSVGSDSSSYPGQGTFTYQNANLTGKASCGEIGNFVLNIP